jgi:hypothetical protein
MTDAVACEAVLLARTVPEETAGGEVSICSAWWCPPLGGLIRIYPLQFGGLKAWRRYRLQLTKSSKDSRWRSFKLADGAPEFIANVGRDALREDLMAASKGKTLRQLNTARDSMGIIRPVELEGVLERDEPDLTRHFGKNTFGVRPRLQFRDADGDHNLGLNDWGCYEWIRKGGDPEQLWHNLRLFYPDREQLLLVGNLRDHRNAWIVIAVVGYGAVQPPLFAQEADRKRGRIFLRDRYECQVCRAKDSLTLDHIVPRTRGGDNEDENLRVLCMSCQCRKGDRLDDEWLAA